MCIGAPTSESSRWRLSRAMFSRRARTVSPISRSVTPMISKARKFAKSSPENLLKSCTPMPSGGLRSIVEAREGAPAEEVLTCSNLLWVRAEVVPIDDNRP